MGIIRYSESESDILGLRLGRAEANSEKFEMLREEIYAQKLDVCILKANCNQPNLFSSLDALSLPYSIGGVVCKYRIFYNDFQPLEYGGNDWSFEILREADTEMEEVVRAVFTREPLSFYDIPTYNSFVSERQEMDCLVDYVMSFNTNDKRLVKVMKGGQLAGLIAFNCNGKVHECVLTGLLPEFQNQGNYLDLVKGCINASYEINPEMKWSYCGARIHNVPSQRTFVKAGLEYFGSFFNIYITPFLNKNLE